MYCCGVVDLYLLYQLMLFARFHHQCQPGGYVASDVANDDDILHMVCSHHNTSYCLADNDSTQLISVTES